MNCKNKLTTIRIRKIVPDEYTLTINPLIEEIVVQLTQATRVYYHNLKVQLVNSTGMK